MLQDKAINAYVLLLGQREQNSAGLEKRPTRFHFFNTFMFSTMIRNDELTYSYDAVYRWSRQLNCKSYDAVFVPVNLGTIHGVLRVFYPQRRHGDTYDSLGFVPTWIPACLVRWGKDDAPVHGHKRGKWTWSRVPCRLQQGGTDCGVFTVTTMDYVSRGLPQASMTGSMDYYRRRMAAELLAGTLL